MNRMILKWGREWGQRIFPTNCAWGKGEADEKIKILCISMES